MTKLYSTKTAAKRLDTTVAGVKYHLYTARDLEPDIQSGGLVFTEETLADFEKRKRGPGRPPKPAGS